MLRLLLLLLAIALAAFGAAWFADHPGRVGVDWLGYRLETSVAALVFGAALLFFVGMALQRLIVLVFRDLPWAGEKRAKRRLARGYAALNEAMVALSAGDRKQAVKLTGRAAALLPAQPLTHMIAAEAAKLSDDRPAAIAHYTALKDDPKAGFLGLRGLIAEARASGRSDEARALTREALDLRPKSRWALTTLFDLDVRAADWAAAEATMRAAEKAGAFPKAAARRHKAALLYCRAVEANQGGDEPRASRLAHEAAKLRPGFVPAALLAARLDRAAGKAKAAEKVIKAAWTDTPHPDLVRLYESLAPTETSHERFKRIAALVDTNRATLESRIAEAEAALAARRHETARSALEAAADSGDPRVFRLLARLAEVGDDPEEAARWRGMAVEAARDARWVCTNCQAHRERWTPLCPSCGSFDSFAWRTTHLAAAPRLGDDSRTLGLLDSGAGHALPYERAQG